MSYLYRSKFIYFATSQVLLSINIFQQYIPSFTIFFLFKKVTVQSEKEKQLFKQVRKDEKRIQKAVSRVIDSDEDEKNKFDPIALREKRIAALRAAQVEPILTKLPTTSSSQQSIIQERYPFVFDSQRDAQENVSILIKCIYIYIFFF